MFERSEDVVSVDSNMVLPVMVETCSEEMDASLFTTLDTNVEMVVILFPEKLEIVSVDARITVPNKEDASIEEATVDWA